MTTIPSAPAQITISSLASAAADISAINTELGDYTGGGGGEASVAVGLVQAETDIGALETAVGTYGGLADLSTDVAAALSSITDLETAVGTYGGGDDLSADVAALLVDASSAADRLVLPLGAFRLSTGDAIPAFADGSADGFTPTESKAQGIRWNDDGTAIIMSEGQIPADWDDAVALTLHCEGARVGAADGTTTLTVTLYESPVGSAYDVDADAGGSTTAFDGSTTVVTDETLTVAAGALRAGKKFSITITPDANLDSDDFILTSVYLVGTRVPRVA